jgi:hypothetical protein
LDSDTDLTPRGLTVNTAGVTRFAGQVGSTARLASLTTDAAGTTRIDGGLVRTSGAQAYNDVVTLGADTVLVSTALGDVTFAQTVDSDADLTPRALTVNTGGVTLFTGQVGGTARLASLTTDAAGTTRINGGLVRTSGAQTYNDVVTLGADTLLTSTALGDVTFGATLDSNADLTPRALTVNTGGVTRFGGQVGGTARLASLTTDAAGVTQINGGLVRTNGFQTYNDGVTLGADAVLTSTALGDVTFAQTVDSDADLTPRALAVNTGGVTRFGGQVGSTARLASLATDAAGTTRISGGLVRTSGFQTYGDIVTLGADTVLTSTALGDIAFARTVDSDSDLTPRALSVNTGGVTQFAGLVGDSARLTSLTTDLGGTTQINGGLGANNRTVRTSRAQSYNDAVTLGADTILTSTSAGGIAFGQTLTGPFNLSAITADGNFAIGGAADLVDLALNVAGSVTTGTLTLHDDLAIRATGTVTTGDITTGAATAIETDGTGAADLLLSPISLAGHDVDINGTTIAVGAIRALGAGSDVRLRAPVTGSGLDLSIDAGGSIGLDGTATARDVALNAGGTVVSGAINATDDIAIRAVGAVTTGTLVSGFGTAVDASGAADALLSPISLAGHDIDVQGLAITIPTATANGSASDLRLATTNGDLTLTTADVGAKAQLTQRGASTLTLTSLTTGRSGDAAADATLASDGSARLGSISSLTGAIGITAGGAVTGLARTPIATDGRIAPDYGRVILSAGTSIGVTAGTNAQLGTITSGTDTIVLAGGTADIDAAVTVGRDYRVTGNVVTLGVSGAAATQQAKGLVAITSLAGGIIGAAGLTLVANSDDTGLGAEAMVLDATGGGINFAPASTLLGGGTARGSLIGIRLGTAGSALQLGVVRARGLQSVNAAGTVFSGLMTSGPITLTNTNVRNALAVTTTNGAITTGPISVTGTRQPLSLTATGAIVATAALASQGDLAISGTDITFTSLTSNAGKATLVGSGTVRGDLLQAFGSASATGGPSVTIATVLAGRAATSAADADCDAAGGGCGRTSSSPTPTPTPVPTLQDINIGAATVTVGTATATGAITMLASNGSLSLGTGTAGTTADLTQRSGAGTMTVGSLSVGNVSGLTAADDVVRPLALAAGDASLLADGAATVTTLLTAHDATVKAASVVVNDRAVAGGALAVTTTSGNLTLPQGGGRSTTTLDVAGTATLATTGVVFAGPATPVTGNTLTLTAGDAVINGAIRAYGVSLGYRPNVSGTMALGAPGGVTGTTFALTDAELDLVQATNLTLDAGAHNVAIGTLSFLPAAGSSRIDIQTTGRIDITGQVTAPGTATRALRLGGDGTSAGRASYIRIAPTADAGGRLLIDTVDLDLRGTRIVVGQDAGFGTPLASASVSDVASAYVGQSSSSLYSSLNGGTTYTAMDILRVNKLTVSFTDVALFQNTATGGVTSGVTAKSLSVFGSGFSAPNAFALFGSLGGVSGNGAALGGGDVLNTNNSINLANSRVNGCLVGSGGGGCLTSVVTVPTIALFNPTQTNLFSLASDLILAFDPVVGSNNEALFFDLGTIQFVPDEDECDPATNKSCVKQGSEGK